MDVSYRMAIGQVPGLANDPNNWSANDVNTIKGLVTDCIPHVRFLDISCEELFEKFVLYDELLPRKLRNDILAYHLQNKKGNSQSQLLRGYKNKVANNTVIEEDEKSNLSASNIEKMPAVNFNLDDNNDESDSNEQDLEMPAVNFNLDDNMMNQTAVNRI